MHNYQIISAAAEYMQYYSTKHVNSMLQLHDVNIKQEAQLLLGWPNGRQMTLVRNSVLVVRQKLGDWPYLSSHSVLLPYSHLPTLVETFK